MLNDPRSRFHVHRSSSPQPNSGDRSAVTQASRSLGSATARAAASRSRTSPRLVDQRARLGAVVRHPPARAHPRGRAAMSGPAPGSRCRRAAGRATASCARRTSSSARRSPVGSRPRRRLPPARASGRHWACRRGRLPRVRRPPGRLRCPGGWTPAEGTAAGASRTSVMTDANTSLTQSRTGRHRTEVRRQPNRVREPLLRAQVHRDVGPTEPVDRLLGVADDEQRAGWHVDVVPVGLRSPQRPRRCARRSRSGSGRCLGTRRGEARVTAPAAPRAPRRCLAAGRGSAPAGRGTPAAPRRALGRCEHGPARQSSGLAVAGIASTRAVLAHLGPPLPRLAGVLDLLECAAPVRPSGHRKGECRSSPVSAARIASGSAATA